MAGDGLPERDAPVDLNVARLIARQVYDALEVDDTLIGWWDHYEDLFDQWWEHGISCACNLDALRYELEDIQGANPKGTVYAEAMRLAFSAFILARQNPYFLLNRRHMDVEAQVRSALLMMIEARQWDGPAEVTFDIAFAQRLATERERQWLRSLIDSAERPVDVDV